MSNPSRQNEKAKRNKKNRVRERERKKRSCEIYIATRQTNQVM